MRGFTLVCGNRPVAIPLSAQRVLAFVALRDRPTLRPHVAAMLWLDASEERALASLRSALWRLRRPGPAVVETRGDSIALHRQVAVDVRDLVARSRRVLNGAGEFANGNLDDIVMAGDLLPDWYDDWVTVERERLRQLRLHALERACVELTVLGEYGRAIEAGLAAVAEEPLHESGHRALIRAHLGEGNRGEALRQFDAYVKVMRDELRLEPSPEIAGLVAGLRA
jgi:DNA-binding SARP family transcriptional activator